MERTELNGLREGIGRLKITRPVGRVQDVDGGVIWVAGLARAVSIGDRMQLSRKDGRRLSGEALRLAEGLVAMLPDDPPDGVSQNDPVIVAGAPVIAPCESWIGRVIDAYGRPLDGRPLAPGPTPRPFRAAPPPAARRKRLGARLETGLAVFNTLLPIVRGQRIGLFAGSGVGKSRLLGAFARDLEADVVVLALIGERGREVGHFVEEVLGPEGMARSVVVAATSDRSALERRRCALAAMSVAEHFRDRGSHVLFLADSITRFAEAHREVAVATGEMPALRGHPASMAHQVMSLAERAGPGEPIQGDITAILAVLVAGSDMDEPVADVLRGTLDGHVVLERAIAERGRFPAVDVLRSVSRSLPEAASGPENETIAEVRRVLGTYDDVEPMVKAGLYRTGSDAAVDFAIRAFPEIDGFLAERGHASAKDSFARLRLCLRRAGPDRKAG